MAEMLLLLAALLPAVVWGIYIYKKDRVEKEPLRLLLGLIISGVIIVIPAVAMENAVRNVIYSVFIENGVWENRLFAASNKYHWFYRLTENMIGVALIEEGCKWTAMWLITHRNHNFNSLFDGVVYAVYVSIGFAAAENIQYAFAFGWATRLVSSTGAPA